MDNYLDKGAMLACATDDAEFVNDFQLFNVSIPQILVYFLILKINGKICIPALENVIFFLNKAVIGTLDEYKNNTDPHRDGDEYYQN